MPEKTTPDSSLVVDLSGWKLKQIKAWTRVAREADFDGMIEILTGVVRSWPFEGQPNDPDAYDNLEFADFMKVSKAVGDQVGEIFRKAS